MAASTGQMPTDQPQNGRSASPRAPKKRRPLPAPIDHLGPGLWAPTSVEKIRPGDTLALRQRATPTPGTVIHPPETGPESANVWLWRLSARDRIIHSPQVSAVQIAGLGPAFVTRSPDPSVPAWELWRFTPARRSTLEPDPSERDTLPIPALPTEEITTNSPGPTATRPTRPEVMSAHPSLGDQVAARRAQRAPRTPRTGGMVGPYRATGYARRPGQPFFDQEDASTW